MQITDVPQRTGMGTRPHAYAQHYRGHPRPPLFLPGIQPQSRLSSPSYGWCGLAFSTHLSMRGSKHCLLGFSLYTPRLGHPQVNYSMGSGSTGQDSPWVQGADVQSPDNHIPQRQTHLTSPQKMFPPHSETRSSLRNTELTLRRIKHLHGVDKMGTGIEVVGSWLLQPSQAEDNPINHGAGGEGAAAGHAGVPCPAPCLQVKGLEGSDGQLALPASYAQRTHSCQCPKLALLACPASRMGPTGCSAGQHEATLGCTRSFSGLGMEEGEGRGAGDAGFAPAARTQDEDLVSLQEGRGSIARGGHGG